MAMAPGLLAQERSGSKCVLQSYLMHWDGHRARLYIVTYTAGCMTAVTRMVGVAAFVAGTS